MLEIPARAEGHGVVLQILDDHVGIQNASGTGRAIPFTAIKSLHIKNTDVFLLKLRLQESALILEFDTLNTRDLAKALVLRALVSPEAAQKAVLDGNLEAKALHSSLKALLGSAVPLPRATGMYMQRATADIFSKDFLGALTQPLVDTFISMNCSLNQFYNLFTTTYFYDIKNAKGSMDRLISENIRTDRSLDSSYGLAGMEDLITDKDECAGGSRRRTDALSGGTRGVDLDYATRINNYSLMALGRIGNPSGEAREVKKKPVEFGPAVPFLHDDQCSAPDERVRVQDEGVCVRGGAADVFRLSPLHCSFEPGLLPEKRLFNFEAKDFELARDLCRVVHSGEHPVEAEARSFSAEFREMVLGQYGPEALQFVERLLPTFYMK